jgi:hypothetical protein
VAVGRNSNATGNGGVAIGGLGQAYDEFNQPIIGADGGAAGGHHRRRRCHGGGQRCAGHRCRQQRVRQCGQGQR